ncbi:hypothetical protein MTR67_048069 [Solanum verrucosum]|uniref:Uncharacterized protein n=1 Tax=Solanum verrucosum TaxID=315347 RepID=A0AAF0UZP6_SOLVR|nr:hypothetical protein MTR67_048069 [Solanum verrucosum]
MTQEISIPTWKWEVINMDFITGLPRTHRQHDFIWVIVDRVTKSAHFFVVKTIDSAEDYAKLYINETVMFHQSRQKSYADVGRRDLEFEINDWVFLKVSPMKEVMIFGKKGKLRPGYDSLTYEEVSVEILDRQVCRLRNKEVSLVKVLWRIRFVEGATWEAEAIEMAKSVTLEILGREKLEWEGVYKPKASKVISFIRDKKLVGQGCLAYFPHIQDVDVESPSIKSILVVSEFNVVFPTDLLVCLRIGIWISTLTWNMTLAPSSSILISWLRQN